MGIIGNIKVHHAFPCAIPRTILPHGTVFENFKLLTLALAEGRHEDRISRLSRIASHSVSVRRDALPGPGAARQQGGDGAAVPNHIAIIMDGNSRWARQHGRPEFMGHQQGVEALRATVQACRRLGVRCLTVFAMSTENWERDPTEIAFLLKLVETVLQQEVEKLMNAGVRLQFVGERSSLPTSLLEEMAR